jgi:hypothetical protein
VLLQEEAACFVLLQEEEHPCRTTSSMRQYGCTCSVESTESTEPLWHLPRK